VKYRRFLVVALPPLALTLTACPPNLGQAPFLCNKGIPECPDGYVCRQKICVREGTALSIDSKLALEVGVPGNDGTALSDRSQPRRDRSIVTVDKKPNLVDKRPGSDQPAVSGKVEITEIMIDPDAVTDSVGEWVELHNAGSQPIDINGWVLKDNALLGDYHQILTSGSFLIPGNGYVVLGRSKNTAINGSAPVDYEYGSDFQLGNTGDEVVLQDQSGNVVDSVSYAKGQGWTVPVGASLSLKSNAGSDHNSFSNWCTETKTWTNSVDKGTPGAPPGC
jgi:hypothetical protein